MVSLFLLTPSLVLAMDEMRIVSLFLLAAHFYELWLFSNLYASISNLGNR